MPASVFPERDPSEWIRSQRPARRTGLDPFKPHGYFLEQEPDGSGRIRGSGVILLTNKECPWHCLMCDLWKDTLTRTIPIGAIPRQIEFALAQFGCEPEQVKLYNSGSFFDPAAIPVADYPWIAQSLFSAKHVVVEAHPRLVGDKAMRFRDELSCSLEVAMGLETIHPQVLPRLNKRFTTQDFARATALLLQERIAVRAFVLLKPPFLDEPEAIAWALKSADFAFDCGVEVVSILPTRAGNGALERLAESGEFSPPTLSALERTFAAALAARRGRVFVDTWDLLQFSSCPVCFERRKIRLESMNLRQVVLPPITCGRCTGSTTSIGASGV